jgi:hypothetical protein
MRLQEDSRLLGDFTADLGCGLVYALLQILSPVRYSNGSSARGTEP